MPYQTDDSITGDPAKPTGALGYSQVTTNWASAERLHTVIKTLKPESAIVTIACMLSRTVYML
jgi:hypothetical protein